MRKRVIVFAGIILLSAVAYATASLNAKPETAAISTFDDIDKFKKSLSSELVKQPESFSVAKAASKLGAYRLAGGFAVCSDKAEIEAKQYVEFSALIDKLKDKPVLLNQFNALLDSDTGVTDCQFRVTEVLSKHAQAN